MVPDHGAEKGVVNELWEQDGIGQVVNQQVDPDHDLHYGLGVEEETGDLGDVDLVVDDGELVGVVQPVVPAD